MRPLFAAFAFLALWPSEIAGQENALRYGELALLWFGDPAVKADLELTSDQLASIRQMKEEINRRYLAARAAKADELRALTENGLGENEYLALRREAMAQIEADAAMELLSRLNDVLVPSQMYRMKQLAIWRTLNDPNGVVRVLADGPIAKLLGITPAQSEELQNRATELQEEFAKKVFDLRLKYRSKVMDKMSPIQRATLKSVLGDPCMVGSLSLKF